MRIYYEIPLLPNCDNFVLPCSKQVPRTVPHSEQGLSGRLPSPCVGISRSIGDHQPVGTTVKVVVKCSSMISTGHQCIDAALPDFMYCFNHLRAAEAASVNMVNAMNVMTVAGAKTQETTDEKVRPRYADCEEGSRRLFVGNLAWEVSWQDLEDHMKFDRSGCRQS
jgi:hypothetical protein